MGSNMDLQSFLLKVKSSKVGARRSKRKPIFTALAPTSDFMGMFAFFPFSLARRSF